MDGVVLEGVVCGVDGRDAAALGAEALIRVARGGERAELGGGKGDVA